MDFLYVDRALPLYDLNHGIRLFVAENVVRLAETLHWPSVIHCVQDILDLGNVAHHLKVRF